MACSSWAPIRSSEIRRLIPASPAAASRPFTVFIVVAEESGDQLGSRLMEALVELTAGDVQFSGTGGSRMARVGLDPILRPGEVDLIGFTGLVSRLPQILRRIREVADAAIACEPDVMVLVDSPEFSHRVARIVRRRAPGIKILNYVSPSVWAWRSARAKKMVPYIDHVLALLPFEPAVYRRLGGPPCSYVGHPLLEKVPQLRPRPGEREPIEQADRPRVLLLPGSRKAEVKYLMGPMGEALALVSDRHGPVDAVLPAVTHLADDIRERVKTWPVQPTIVEGEDAKYAAFRSAHAALAASGTVSLELALAGVPTVVTYRIETIVQPFKWLLRVPSVVLANVVLGDRVIPELLDRKSKPRRLARALLPLLRPGPEREKQTQAFSLLDEIMAFADGPPSVRAAEMILQLAGRNTRHS